MELLYWFESLRCPVLDQIMMLITAFGGELFFLITALILFWCVDKRQGYFVMSVGFLGTLANQFLKIACRVPRPWVRDPSFTIVESARAGASGYSFPSGHSQNAVGTFGSIALCARKKWVKFACIALAVLVPISRMYLGVHTPADVLTAACMALALMLLLKPVCLGRNGAAMPLLLGVMAVFALGFIAYVELFPFPADTDAENLASAVKNAYTLAGALFGMLVVYFVDEKYLHFPTHAVWYAQIAKVLLGILLVLGIKEGLKPLLEPLFHGHMAGRGFRYFLVVIAAGLLWPATFRWFGRLGKPNSERKDR